MTNKLNTEFPYKSSFSSSVKCIFDEDKSKFLSLASIDNLKSIIPAEFFSNGYQDLLPIASNLAAIGMKNKNDDAMTIEIAAKIYKSLIHKQLNAEHSRSNIIGHIINAGFSKYNSEYVLGNGNEIISEEDALKEENGVVNLCYAAALYKVAHPKLIEKVIQANDPSSSEYLSICSSWEVGFAEYDIAIGSPIIKEATIIKKGDKDFEEYDKVLKANGGIGIKDGKYVYRVLAGEPIFLGGGLTYNPASQVKGVFTPLEEETEEIEASTKESSEVLLTCEASEHYIEKCSCGEILNQCRCASNSKKITISEKKCPKCEKNEQIISHIKEPNVINNNKIRKYMKFKSIKDITDENLKEATAASVIEVFESAILEKSREWLQEKETKENEIKQAKADIEKAKADAEKNASELNQVKAELQKVQDAIAAKDAEDKFTQRMSSFDEEYELDSDTREILASDLKDMSDEGFESYAKKMKVMLKDKNKALKKEKEEKKEVKASVDDKEEKGKTLDKALESAEQINASANGGTEQLSLKDKMKRAFDMNEGFEYEGTRKQKSKE